MGMAFVLGVGLSHAISPRLPLTDELGNLVRARVSEATARSTGERGSFSEEDYIAFPDQAHQRLRAPIVLIWDNLNTHVSRRMRALIATRGWLTVIRLPAYAPD